MVDYLLSYATQILVVADEGWLEICLNIRSDQTPKS